MLTDPVEGFLSGISSGVARLLLGIFAILAGFSIPYFSLGWNDDFLIGWVLVPFVIFIWGTYGLWFFIAPLLISLTFTFLLAFLHDRHPKTALFLTFTSATLYAAPLTIVEERWLRTLCIYLFLSSCYWFLPWIIARLAGPEET